MDENAITPDRKPDFLLTIHFPPGLKNPQRVFAVASECVEALQACDQMLLKSFPTEIQPVLVLDQVESGSLKIWFKQFLEAVEDDALKNIDWKPAVGKYLVKGKYFLLKHLEGGPGLPQKETLREVSQGLHELAKETDALKLPAYTPVSEVDIAKQAKILSDSLKKLVDGESISLEGDAGTATIKAGFSVTDEDVANLLVNRTLENTSEVILMVRKPDFLGETKWDFRFNRRNLSVAIIDKEWLSRFQAGEIDIRPGDALHVQMKEIISYDANGEVVNEEREVVRVIDVIRKQEQCSLI